MSTGRQSRTDRMTNTHVGMWATSSQDYMLLVRDLFSHSAQEATIHRNMSAYAFAGIPMLFSALRAFLIECNSGVYGLAANREALLRLAKEPNELALLRDEYALNPELIDKLSLLYEVRNEIVHPSPRPAGTADSTPDYIRPLKDLGVLHSTGEPASDYWWMAQLQSHRLFRFACTVVETVAAKVIDVHRSHDAHFECHNLRTYGEYRKVDL